MTRCSAARAVEGVSCCWPSRGVGASALATGEATAAQATADAPSRIIPRRFRPRGRGGAGDAADVRENRSKRSEEHTSELQSLMRISYAVFCLKNKKQH